MHSTSNDSPERVIRAFLVQKQSEQLTANLKELLESYQNRAEVRGAALFAGKKEKEESLLAFRERQFDQLDELLGEEALREKKEAIYKEAAEKFEANRWLESNHKGASSVRFATHVPKLTHSSIPKEATTFVDSTGTTDPKYLTTSALLQKEMDGAVFGNQYAPIYQLLELKIGGKPLSELLLKGPYNPFSAFTEDPEQAQRWLVAFRQSSLSEGLRSHNLSKQVFFPTEAGHSNYHLLINVQSSSIAHAVHLAKWQDQKSTNSSRQKGVYSPEVHLSFTGGAKIAVTASNHSNASQLNGKRGGKVQLFSCAPPTWKSDLQPPKGSCMFSGDFLRGKQTQAALASLASLLTACEVHGLSQREPTRYANIKGIVAQLVDSHCDYAQRIHLLPAGWSAQCSLPVHQQSWLDPHREDPAFLKDRPSGELSEIVSNNFAKWLNYQLRRKKKGLALGKEQAALWVRMSKESFRIANPLLHK